MFPRMSAPTISNSAQKLKVVAGGLDPTGNIMKLRYLALLTVLLVGCSPKQFVLECKIASVGDASPKGVFRGTRVVDLKNQTVDNHSASISDESISWMNEGALYVLDRKTGNLSVGEQMPNEPARVTEKYSGHCERKDKGRFERWFNP